VRREVLGRDAVDGADSNTHHLGRQHCPHAQIERARRGERRHSTKQERVGPLDAQGGVTVQGFVWDHRPMIAAPVQCHVDGIAKRSHGERGYSRWRRRATVPSTDAAPSSVMTQAATVTAVRTEA